MFNYLKKCLLLFLLHINTYKHAHSPPPPPAYFNTAARSVPGGQGQVNTRQKVRAGQEEGGQQETGEVEQKVSASEEGVGFAGEKGLFKYYNCETFAYNCGRHPFYNWEKHELLTIPLQKCTLTVTSDKRE